MGVIIRTRCDLGDRDTDAYAKNGAKEAGSDADSVRTVDRCQFDTVSDTDTEPERSSEPDPVSERAGTNADAAERSAAGSYAETRSRSDDRSYSGT